MSGRESPEAPEKQPADAAGAERGIRIGLVSDTHGRMRAGVLERLAGVLRILHAGDVGSPDVLRELELVAPVTAVFGNTDSWELRRSLPREARIEEAGRRIVVVHGDALGSPTPARLALAYPDADIIVFGHTHHAGVERRDGRLMINPGSAGPARFHLKPSIAILTLADSTEAVEILEL